MLRGFALNATNCLETEQAIRSTGLNAQATIAQPYMRLNGHGTNQENYILVLPWEFVKSANKALHRIAQKTGSR
jgi:hypothetical protein